MTLTHDAQTAINRSNCTGGRDDVTVVHIEHVRQKVGPGKAQGEKFATSPMGCRAARPTGPASLQHKGAQAQADNPGAAWACRSASDRTAGAAFSDGSRPGSMTISAFSIASRPPGTSISTPWSQRTRPGAACAVAHSVRRLSSWRWRYPEHDARHRDEKG